MKLFRVRFKGLREALGERQLTGGVKTAACKWLFVCLELPASLFRKMEKKIRFSSFSKPVALCKQARRYN